MGVILNTILFKIWIFNFDFTTILSFLVGALSGALIVLLLYAFFVLASLRDKKFIIKTEDDSLTVKEVKDLIEVAQKTYKDKKLRGKQGRIGYCASISKDLVYGIAAKFFPKSKYPLLELSVDEFMMLTIYVEKRLEEIVNRRGLRLFKKTKISQIMVWTNATNKVTSSQAFKVANEVKTVSGRVMKVLNVINPLTLIRKVTFEKAINLIIDKLCIVAIAVVGEETFKIYSKTVFNKTVEVDSNIDQVLKSIDDDFKSALTEEEIVEEEEPQNENYKFMKRSYKLKGFNDSKVLKLDDAKFMVRSDDIEEEGK